LLDLPEGAADDPEPATRLASDQATDDDGSRETQPMSGSAARVPTAPRYRPELVEPAYEDPEAVLRLVQDRGPYPNLAGMAGYAGFELPTMPWWRTSLMDADLGEIVENSRFIESARRVFDSEVVRPKSVTVNLMAPQPAGGVHLDTASFRGSFPSSSWLLAVMGSSGLFDRWAVRVPAALTWFYPGPAGGYEYWPDGPRCDPSIVEGPFGNVALVGDNDYMFHRVRAFGDPARFGDVARYSSASTVSWKDGAWVVADDGVDRVRYSPHEMRISLLWRAIAFADGEAARVHDEHLDDLDADTLVGVFLDDLHDRGVNCERPANHLEDDAWVRALNDTYGVGGFEPETT
jgi:hypothetical protein